MSLYSTLINRIPFPKALYKMNITCRVKLLLIVRFSKAVCFEFFGAFLWYPACRLQQEEGPKSMVQQMQMMNYRPECS